MTALLSLWRTLTGEEQTGLILVLLVWAVLWLLVWRDFVRDVHTFVGWTLGWGRGVKIQFKYAGVAQDKSTATVMRRMDACGCDERQGTEPVPPTRASATVVQTVPPAPYFERPASGEARTGRAGVSAARFLCETRSPDGDGHLASRRTTDDAAYLNASRAGSEPAESHAPFERSPVEGVHVARATVGSAPTDSDAGARSARSFPSPAAKGFAAQRVGRIR